MGEPPKAYGIIGDFGEKKFKRVRELRGERLASDNDCDGSTTTTATAPRGSAYSP